jgi:hypothetical protein
MPMSVLSQRRDLGYATGHDMSGYYSRNRENGD